MMMESLRVSIEKNKAEEVELKKFMINRSMKGRFYLNYSGQRPLFLMKNVKLLFGVAQHSKFAAKLTVKVSNNAIIALMNGISIKFRDVFDAKHDQIYKEILHDNERTSSRCLKLKIPEGFKMSCGKAIRGGLAPNDLVDIAFHANPYSYSPYYGFSCNLVECAKVEENIIIVD